MEGWGGGHSDVPYMPTVDTNDLYVITETGGNPKKLHSVKANKSIWVTFQKVGYHRYPQASVDPKLNDVSYLGFEHRHLFKFRVEIEVFHDDRELEFHQFLKYCETFFADGQQANHKSCEMISDDLYKHIVERFPGRLITIEVAEDGECGSRATYFP